MKLCTFPLWYCTYLHEQMLYIAPFLWFFWFDWMVNQKKSKVLCTPTWRIITTFSLSTQGKQNSTWILVPVGFAVSLRAWGKKYTPKKIGSGRIYLWLFNLASKAQCLWCLRSIFAWLLSRWENWLHCHRLIFHPGKWKDVTDW